MRQDTPAPRGSVMPERRARQRADDSAFAGPRSPTPLATRGRLMAFVIIVKIVVCGNLGIPIQVRLGLLCGTEKV